MFEILLTAANAIVPIILLIVLGYVLRQKNILTDEFSRVGNKLVFNLCLPAMMVLNVYAMEGLHAIRWDVVGYCLAVTLLIFAFGMVSAVLTTKVPERRGVIAQCTFRSNYAIIGMAVVGALGGDEALAVATVASAFAVPLFNILAVIALSVFVQQGDGGKPDPLAIVKSVLKNPIIIGVALGMVCLVIRQLELQLFGEVVFTLKDDLKFIYATVNYLKSMASPLALIVLGARFVFSAVKELWKEIVVGTLWRTVLAPVLGVGLALLLSTYTDLLSFGPAEYPTLITLFGSPVAVSSAIMAGQMGNDQQLATQLTVWTNLVSIFTVFFSVCVMMGAGLL